MVLFPAEEHVPITMIVLAIRSAEMGVGVLVKLRHLAAAAADLSGEYLDGCRF